MLDALATAFALRQVELKSFEQYFDTLISHRTTREEWLALYAKGVERARNTGQRRPASYSSREEFKKEVAKDLEQARDLIRQYAKRGIKALGNGCYSAAAAADLLKRLSLPAPELTPPGRIATVIDVLPLLFDTTRDIGTAASVIQIHDRDGIISIPAVNLTSSFNVTLTQISRLLVRRTFFLQDGPAEERVAGAVATLLERGAIFLTPERSLLSALQRDARALFHLLGIWAVGEPFATPPVDQSVLDSAMLDTAEGEYLVNTITLFHKSGWCLFEALHEIGHILAGDWRLPVEEWVPELETRADHFAACCLLLNKDEFSRVWELRGVCSFLRLLGLLEQRFGRTSAHPAAWDRANWVEEFVLQSGLLDDGDTMLFIASRQLDLLAAYCQNPGDFGYRGDQIFGESHGPII